MKLEILHLPGKGGAKRPPLLFVHGSYSAAWIWTKDFMPYFAAAGWDCHALSLRGHGGSDGTVEWASLADYVADVAWAVDQLDTPPVLIGHSMGGLVAQHVVAAGHAAAGMVLLASTPPSGLGSSSLHMMAHASDVLFQLGLLQSLGPGAVSPQVMHRALFSDHTDPAHVAWMMDHLQKESSRVAAELLMPSKPWPPAQRMPVLVLGGDKDMFLPVSAFQETATHWDAELRVIAGAPHGLMADSRYWRPCADVMVEWLTRQNGGAA
ncbi:MAG: alpha/beta fold hydrolase [Magnetospirillum gryphiswaldense]|nr:alpha/beta fold hydrolase [Magnetospirillum gryphiswaldense]